MDFRSTITSIIFLAFLFLSFLSVPVGGFVGRAISSPQLHFIMIAEPLEEPLAPGMTDVPINFTLINANTFPLYNVNVSAFSVYPFSLIHYYNDSQNVSVIQWAPGQAIHVIYYYNINGSASNGVYNISLKVAGPIFIFSHFHETLNASVAILGYAKASVQAVWGSPTSPQLVAPGENDVPVTLILDNQGNVMLSNVSLLLTSAYPIKFMQSYLNVGYLPPGQPVEITTYASVYPNATSGIYQLPALIQYFSNSRIPVTVSVPVTGYSNFSVTTVWGSPTDPQVVAGGSTRVPLTIIINNLGDVNAVNVSITLPENYFPIHFLQSSAYLGIIPAGLYSESTVIASVYPNATPGVYYVPITIHYFSTERTVYAPIDVLGYAKASVQAVWGSPTSPQLVAPGENDVPVTLILDNQGNVMLSNVSLLLTSAYPIKFMQSYLNVGYLPPGQPVEITTYASVYPNATSGIYQLPALIQYFSGQEIQTFITVPVVGYESFSVSSLWGSPSSPITAAPGQTNLPLTFVVRNVGDVNAFNVSLYFPGDEYPLALTQSSLQLGIIPAGQLNEGTITASVYPNATPGTYYVPVIVHYSDVNLTTYVPVVIYPPKISLSIFTVPPQVFPGFYDVKVEAVMTNYGEATAQNAYVTLSSPFPLVSQGNLTVGDIPPGTPINVTFLINVPDGTAPGNYKLTFSVNYDGGSYLKSYTLTVYPKANLTIVQVIYPSFQPGDTNVPITIVLKNVGNVTAKNVRAILGTSDVIYPHVSSSNPLQALTASQTSLGDISPGQEVNLTYVVDVSGGASPGYYPLTLTLVWNQTGSFVPFVQNDHFQVQVTPPLTSVIAQNPLFYVGIVIVVVIIVILLLVLRRRKK
ncbi:S-layer domain-containing protein [Metallosphaera yellowstonensis MK1]|uniref:S-layer domain-containing protein n=1 Tax=Metallosphaera yellowstonensis MK1 TaxID=671065 RepID=H2C2V2_9CREN|nr:NEW3 domain-containing protein [Metallosphaera yellowstonensis]EHP70573.1 S-layer domain-containing protein [Metallosphaera yellowstonensis MK1]